MMVLGRFMVFWVISCIKEYLLLDKELGMVYLMVWYFMVEKIIILFFLIMIEKKLLKLE